MRRILMTLVFLGAALATSPAYAAATVMITSTSNDIVGQSIVYNLRDQINRSSLYKVVYTRDDAGFIINIVTLKQDEGNRSAYGAVLTMPPFDKKGFDYYVTSIVGYCGASVTQQCASNILSSFDQDMAEIVKDLNEALKKPK